MPRKTDGIPFELQPGPIKDDEGNPFLYAKPVIKYKYDLDAFASYCAKENTRTKGEMLYYLSVFKEAAIQLLKEGNRVETPFGSFAPKLKLQGKHTDADKVKGRDVEYSGVEFIPSKEFVEKANCSRHGFRLEKKSVGNRQMYDPKAMEEALRRCTGRGFTTIKAFMVFSGLKYQSAKRYLDSLCISEKPRLYRSKEGGTWCYFVTTPSNG